MKICCEAVCASRSVRGSQARCTRKRTHKLILSTQISKVMLCTQHANKLRGRGWIDTIWGEVWDGEGVRLEDVRIGRLEP